MKKNQKSVIIFFVVLFSCNTLYADTVLKFGLFPFYSTRDMIRLFSPIAKKIEQETDVKVEFYSALTKKEFNKKTLQDSFDIIWTCPACYLKAAKNRQFYAIARGEPSFKGIVIVRKDSKINDIIDLKGKKIAAIGEHSLAGYLFLRNDLAELGIVAPKNITIDFISTSESIPFKVHSESYDAGVFSEDTLVRSEVLKTIWDDLKIIHESRLIPQPPFAVRADLNKALVKTIQDVLTRTPLQDKDYTQFLAGLNLTGIIAANDASYDEFREFYKKIKHYSKSKQNEK